MKILDKRGVAISIILSAFFGRLLIMQKGHYFLINPGQDKYKDKLSINS